MYKPGDDKLEVRELLVKAFASAWEAGDKAVDRDTYINSSINVIDSLQVGPEMIYGEEGQGLLDDELDHLPDMLRAGRRVGLLRRARRELLHPDLDGGRRKGRRQGQLPEGRG